MRIVAICAAVSLAAAPEGAIAAMTGRAGVGARGGGASGDDGVDGARPTLLRVDVAECGGGAFQRERGERGAVGVEDFQRLGVGDCGGKGGCVAQGYGLAVDREAGGRALGGGLIVAGFDRQRDLAAAVRDRAGLSHEVEREIVLADARVGEERAERATQGVVAAYGPVGEGLRGAGLGRRVRVGRLWCRRGCGSGLGLGLGRGVGLGLRRGLARRTGRHQRQHDEGGQEGREGGKDRFAQHTCSLARWQRGEKRLGRGQQIRRVMCRRSV
ncbi:hypothetical protein QP181_15345 [Sphingomonas sp. LR55]